MDWPKPYMDSHKPEYGTRNPYMDLPKPYMDWPKPNTFRTNIHATNSYPFHVYIFFSLHTALRYIRTNYYEKEGGVRKMGYGIKFARAQSIPFSGIMHRKKRNTQYIYRVSVRWHQEQINILICFSALCDIHLVFVKIFHGKVSKNGSHRQSPPRRQCRG